MTKIAIRHTVFLLFLTLFLSIEGRIFPGSLIRGFRSFLSKAGRSIGRKFPIGNKQTLQSSNNPMSFGVSDLFSSDKALVPAQRSAQDAEIRHKLLLAGVSLLETVARLAIYGITWMLFIRSAGSAISKSGLFSDRLAGNATCSDELTSFLKPGEVLTEEETALFAQCQLPSSIADSWENLGGLQAVKESLTQQFFLTDDSADNPHVEHNLDPSYNGNISSSHRTTNMKNKNDGNVSNTNKHRFRTNKIESCHSALLYGPPGCGKTSLLRGTCRRLRCPLLEVTPSMVQQRFFGDSTKTIRAIFTLMKKMRRCVIFIDEIDALFAARHSLEAAHDRSIKTEFMQLWDQSLRERDTAHNIFIFGATNRPQDLDPAILRRFQRSFVIPLPSAKDRLAIWKTLLADYLPAKNKSKKGANIADTSYDGTSSSNSVDEKAQKEKFDYQRCVELTDGYSASDIDGLVQSAVSSVQRDRPTEDGRPLLRIQDIEEAMRVYVPTSWAAASYQEPQRHFQPQTSNDHSNRFFNHHRNQNHINGNTNRNKNDTYEDDDDEDEDEGGETADDPDAAFLSWSSPSPFDDQQ